MEVSIDKHIEEALQAGKGWSDEERRRYLESIDDESHPFFAEADKVDPGIAEAFRKLTYEDETHESLAEHFKHEGNERFKRSKLNRLYYKHAASFYTEAIKHSVLAEQTVAIVELRATLLANRAAANIGNKNYGSVKRDCDESLRLMPGNLKCYYRKAIALEKLKQYAEAIACCKEAFSIDPDSKDIVNILERCEENLNEARLLRDKNSEDTEKRQNELTLIYKLLVSRNIMIGPSEFDELHRNWMTDHFPRLIENKIVWPLLLLYPGSNQSDVVEDVSEDDTVLDLLSTVFPDSGDPPVWDAESYEYRCSNLDAFLKLNAVRSFASEEEFIESTKVKWLSGSGSFSEKQDFTSKQSYSIDDDYADWVHVHPSCSFQQIAQCPKYVISGGIITLYVFPRNSLSKRDFLRKLKSKPTKLSP